MIEVEQTIFMPPHGDCFVACLASILDLPLDEVPAFTGPDWHARYEDWLAGRGLGMVTFGIPPDDGGWRPRGLAILAADSPRGPWLHAVVCRDGAVIWDPSPERSQGLGTWREWTILTALDAGRIRVGA